MIFFSGLKFIFHWKAQSLILFFVVVILQSFEDLPKPNKRLHS